MDFFRQAIRTAPSKEPASDQQIEEDASRLLNEIALSAERDRLRTFVSCWHSNTGESEALWRLYCPPNTMGVAVQTDSGLLMEALGNKAKVKIGQVQYIDFKKSYAGLHDRIFWKRKSLSHEAEIRAVIKERHESKEFGISLTADLEKLFISIVPSPFAPIWFSQLVKSTLARYNISSHVAESELRLEPFF